MNLDEIHDQVHDLLDLVHEQVRSFDQQQNPDPLESRVVNNLEIALELWLDMFDAPASDDSDQPEPRPARVN